MSPRPFVGMKIPADRGIYRFRSAGSEIDLFRQASENPGDRFRRRFLLLFRNKPKPVKRTGIPVTLLTGKLFRNKGGNFRKRPGCRTVIKIDQKTSPSLNGKLRIRKLHVIRIERKQRLNLLFQKCRYLFRTSSDI